MSLNVKKEKIDELFTDNSDIYPLEHVGYNWYEFTDGIYKYRVRETNEIIFSYYDEYNNMWITEPTKNNKNQFKILNTVIYCFKQIIKNNTDGRITFSGQVSNGLAKLYIILFNKLKDFIIRNGFVGFYTDNDFEIYFFLFKKEIFDYSYWKKRMDPESLIGYTPETNMKKNIKESTSISITNSDGSSFSITCDDANELNQIMKNAGLSNYLLPKDDLGDLPEISDDEIIDYTLDDIPSYEYDLGDYDFGIDATDYDISYEDPYGNLADEVGYVIDDELAEVAELNSSVPYEEDAEESLFNMKGTAHQSDMRYVPGMMSDNPMVDELRESNSFDDEVNDAMTYCREDIDDSDMLDALDLNQAGPIDVRIKSILISKLANYLYTRYVEDITNGNTQLTPNNFEGIASVIFEDRLWDLLQDEGFYWTSNND